MANCSYCDSFIVFGGKTDATGRYCNEKCRRAGNLVALSAQVPRQELDRMLDEIYRGNCPRCGGLGPIDVHKAHQVWSALVLTSWSSKPELSCKPCATKRQLGATLFSGVCGWWGLPWGLVLTPIQVTRNIVEMVSGPKHGVPSPLLQKFVRVQAGAHWLQKSRPQTPAPSGPLPPRIPTASQPAGDDRYMPKS
jgi:hypothetical protein